VSDLNNDIFSWLYSLALLVLGFLLILLEVFVIPGFNIFGVFGFGSLCVGVLYAYKTMGVWPATAIAATAILGTIFLVRFIIRRRTWQKLILQSDTSRTDGYDASQQNIAHLMDKTGQTQTPLRPSGRALIEDQLVDVVSEGEFIDRERPVIVVEISGNRVVVREQLDLD
jgi:membrane-bound serine protease (ClpP class)